MNTIRELKQQEKYSNMLKRKNKEKNIYKNRNSTLRIEKMNLIKAIERKDKEIERLNNIINEIEKYINETKLEEFEKEYGRRYGKTFTQAEVIICNMILNKLQELKGSDK